jgi:hypothetical protein
VPKRSGSGAQGRAGGDDIVDDDHPTSDKARPGRELRAVEPLDARPACLGCGGAGPNEQPTARHPELTGDVAGDEFTLVEPS